MDTHEPYTTRNHSDHDPSWMVVCSGHYEVVCVACLVEQIEDQGLPLVQRKVVLSLLSSLLQESREVATMFGDNIMLSRHTLDVVTDHFFTKDNQVDSPVEICKTILECAQSEDLVWYTVDKFHFLLQNSGDLTSTSAYLLLLGRLLAISPTYGFHLLKTHEVLLHMMLSLLPQTEDESCQCSAVYVLLQLFHDSLQSDMSPTIKSLVLQVLVTMLLDADNLDLKVNLLALLKKVLQQADEADIKFMMTPTPDGRSLLMGLKKMFLTKQEVLQTATAQCVLGLVLRFWDGNTVTQILESDLTEFLFESLHTQSVPQLNSVYQCLQMLASFDQFFTRCHAVYGVESILGSLDMVLDRKSYNMVEKGFCLLADMLDKQPSSIPLFVNVSSMKQSIRLVLRGLSLPHTQVFLQAARTAQVLIRKQYISWPVNCEMIRDILKAASPQMARFLSCKTVSKTRHHTDDEQLYNTLVGLLSSICSEYTSAKISKEDTNDKQKQCFHDIMSVLVSAVRSHLFPVLEAELTTHDVSPHLQPTLEYMNNLYTASGDELSWMSLSCVKTGVLVRAHLLKISGSKVCETLSTFLTHIYRQLIDITTPVKTSHPSWLMSGISKLRLESVDPAYLVTVVGGEEDTAWTLLLMLYLSYLYDYSCVTTQPLQMLLDVFVAQCTAVSELPPLVLRSLMFLTACASEDTTNVNSFQDFRPLVSVIENCPLEVWYTHHPVLILWVFNSDDLAHRLGNKVLEYWLPQLELGSVDVKRYPENGQGSTEQCGEVPTVDAEADMEIVEDLVNSPAFMRALVAALLGPVAASDQALVLTQHLINKVCDSQDTISVISDASSKQLSEIFLQDQPPPDYQVHHVLQVMTSAMEKQTQQISEVFNIKIVCHVLKYFGSLRIENSSCTEVCLEYLLKCMDLTDQSISPILVQNQVFMKRLETSLYSTVSADVDVTRKLVARLADTDTAQHLDFHQILVSHSYLLEAVKSGVSAIQPGILCLLSVALSTDSTNSRPVLFSRDCLVQDTPLFTSLEIRTIYFSLQQLVCQDSSEIFLYSLECIHRLYKYCEVNHSPLSSYLVSHPWNMLWLEMLLHIAPNHGGLGNNTLHILEEFCEFTEGQALLGELGEPFLQLVLGSVLESDQAERLVQIITQCRPHLEKSCQSQLMDQTQTHLNNTFGMVC